MSFIYYVFISFFKCLTSKKYIFKDEDNSQKFVALGDLTQIKQLQYIPD